MKSILVNVFEGRLFIGNSGVANNNRAAGNITLNTIPLPTCLFIV